MPAVCKAALSTGQSRDPVLCSARGLSGSRASLGVFLPPSGAQVRVSLGWPCWRRERADGDPILRSVLFTNLGRSHAANGGRASASGPLVPGTQTFRAAWPALEGSREAKTAGGLCTAGAKQGRGWGETGRPRQDVASAVTGKHGVWTGPAVSLSSTGITKPCSALGRMHLRAQAPGLPGSHPPSGATLTSPSLLRAEVNTVPAQWGDGGGGSCCREIKCRVNVWTVRVHRMSQ